MPPVAATVGQSHTYGVHQSDNHGQHSQIGQDAQEHGGSYVGETQVEHAGLRQSQRAEAEGVPHSNGGWGTIQQLRHHLERRDEQLCQLCQRVDGLVHAVAQWCALLQEGETELRKTRADWDELLGFLNTLHYQKEQSELKCNECALVIQELRQSLLAERRKRGPGQGGQAGQLQKAAAQSGVAVQALADAFVSLKGDISRLRHDVSAGSLEVAEKLRLVDEAAGKCRGRQQPALQKQAVAGIANELAQTRRAISLVKQWLAGTQSVEIDSGMLKGCVDGFMRRRAEAPRKDAEQPQQMPRERRRPTDEQQQGLHGVNAHAIVQNNDQSRGDDTQATYMQPTISHILKDLKNGYKLGEIQQKAQEKAREYIRKSMKNDVHSKNANNEMMLLQENNKILLSQKKSLKAQIAQLCKQNQDLQEKLNEAISQQSAKTSINDRNVADSGGSTSLQLSQANEQNSRNPVLDKLRLKYSSLLQTSTGNYYSEDSQLLLRSIQQLNKEFQSNYYQIFHINEINEFVQTQQHILNEYQQVFKSIEPALRQLVELYDDTSASDSLYRLNNTQKACKTANQQYHYISLLISHINKNNDKMTRFRISSMNGFNDTALEINQNTYNQLYFQGKQKEGIVERMQENRHRRLQQCVKEAINAELNELSAQNAGQNAILSNRVSTIQEHLAKTEKAVERLCHPEHNGTGAADASLAASQIQAEGRWIRDKAMEIRQELNNYGTCLESAVRKSAYLNEIICTGQHTNNYIELTRRILEGEENRDLEQLEKNIDKYNNIVAKMQLD